MPCNKNINRFGCVFHKEHSLRFTVLSDHEKRAAAENQSSQRCERHEDLLHFDIASFFGSLFFASRTGYIRYAFAEPVNFSNNASNRSV